MQEKARQMQTLLDDLLTLSQLQSHERTGTEEAVDVPALLMALKEQAEELSRGRHTLRFEIQPGLGLTGIRADLESAFRNLVSNAIHYTPEPGTITVRWELADDGPVLSVIDTGIGIPSRETPHRAVLQGRLGPGAARRWHRARPVHRQARAECTPGPPAGRERTRHRQPFFLHLPRRPRRLRLSPTGKASALTVAGALACHETVTLHS